MLRRSLSLTKTIATLIGRKRCRQMDRITGMNWSKLKCRTRFKTHLAQFFNIQQLRCFSLFALPSTGAFSCLNKGKWFKMSFCLCEDGTPPNPSDGIPKIQVDLNPYGSSSVFRDSVVQSIADGGFSNVHSYRYASSMWKQWRSLLFKISWMEKFVRNGIKITAPVPMASPRTTSLGGFEAPSSKGDALRCDESNLNVGVLHLVPSLEVFPLLADPKTYETNTIDLADLNELEYWFSVLSEHLPDLVDKAVPSEGGTYDARRKGNAFAQAFSAHLARLMEEGAAYGKLGLANLLELREECLREFNFFDAYTTIKQREKEASLAILPYHLMELDS
ncbi:hypothetical protein L1987_24792 [Smallanthus sonchifolius]|uniref:Uncharacterized protein n=1 Tax=Smallanthus sonchifolius TaxID=185202 RepID=A0ACB9ILF2_9ASTR|nr:hypothetical protein L1987_24792 [Smallanthus sonchifolius]